MDKDTRNYYERELDLIDFNGCSPLKILIWSDGKTTRPLDINKESAAALIHRLTAFLIAPERADPQQQIDEGTAAAYRRGYAAYQIGNREFDNPYECGDDRGAAWRDGMRDARSDSSFHNPRARSVKRGHNL